MHAMSACYRDQCVGKLAGSGLIGFGNELGLGLILVWFVVVVMGRRLRVLVVGYWAVNGGG